jgi:hypothetical protein
VLSDWQIEELDISARQNARLYGELVRNIASERDRILHIGPVERGEFFSRLPSDPATGGMAVEFASDLQKPQTYAFAREAGRLSSEAYGLADVAGVPLGAVGNIWSSIASVPIQLLNIHRLFSPSPYSLTFACHPVATCRTEGGP